MIRKLQILLMLVALVIPVSAQENQQRGSIRLTLACESQPVNGGSVALYYLPDQIATDNMDKLVNEVEKMKCRKVTQMVDDAGAVLFADLASGNYLLVQETAAEGYYPIKSFCVRLPMHIGGNSIYDIEAAPKLEKLPGDKLPQTGLILWPAWVLVGFGTLAIGAGIAIGKRKQ